MDVQKKILLGALFGILLGISYAPFSAGFFACFAFVPFFIALERQERFAEILRFSYGSFFLYNFITLYWPGGFTHGKDIFLMLAGGILLLAHPLFYFVPIIAWSMTRRKIGFMNSLYLFPVYWVAFEYLDSSTQFAFPWLSIGTTQTYDLSIIQFSSFTGVYGVSFWVVLINVLLYRLFVNCRRTPMELFNGRSILLVAIILALYLTAKTYGSAGSERSDNTSGASLRIGSIQPNIDPFEKWAGDSDPQIAILQQMTGVVGQSDVDLILWPETAVPYYVLEPRYSGTLEKIRRLIDSLDTPLLAGIPDITYYSDESAAPSGSNHTQGGVVYETFNSSMLLHPRSHEVQKYAKILLVPFAERVPYSDLLGFLNATKWNFGMGGWNSGRDATVLHLTTRDGRSVKFSNMICYESIFPGFVARFVRGGAEFLTVLTNDSWWGNTSGPYQHVQIEILRAVENHRWVLQCSNGGISCAIDPRGIIHHQTGMFMRTSIISTIEPRKDLTFYSEHGDWFAGGCAWLSVISVAGIFGWHIYDTRMKKERS